MRPLIIGLMGIAISIGYMSYNELIYKPQENSRHIAEVAIGSARATIAACSNLIAAQGPTVPERELAGANGHLKSAVDAYMRKQFFDAERFAQDAGKAVTSLPYHCFQIEMGPPREPERG